jgi:AmiR/NasT family two-component response regulator
MRDLISTTMADQSDIELVGEVGKQQDLAEAVADTRPDVVVIPMDDEKEYRVQCGFLLGRYPEMKIIVLAPEQNRAFLYWAILEIRNKSIESSEEGILNAMRQRPQVAGLAQI